MSGGYNVIGNQSILSRMVALTKATSDVTTNQTTTSTSYTNLATTGPSITLTPGVTQDYILAGKSYVYSNTGGNNVFAGISVAGATPLDKYAVTVTSPNNVSIEAATATIVASSHANNTSDLLQYRVVSGTGAYQNRVITGWAT